MYFISRQEALMRDDIESMIAIKKRDDGNIYLLADLEDNEPAYERLGDELDARCHLRISYYSETWNDWLLERSELEAPDVSALEESFGRYPGGITYGFEDEGDWNVYENIFDCLFDYFYDAHEDVAVVEESGAECFELESGQWFVLREHTGILI